MTEEPDRAAQAQVRHLGFEIAGDVALATSDQELSGRALGDDIGERRDCRVQTLLVLVATDAQDDQLIGMEVQGSTDLGASLRASVTKPASVAAAE